MKPVLRLGLFVAPVVMVFLTSDPVLAQVGADISYPVPLNSNATTDSGRDEYPQVTTDSAGNWVAVWYSRDDLGGTIETDEDI